MANIYLLINYSICDNWLAATMRANQQTLAGYGIDLAPFDRANPDFIPYHGAFWHASPTVPLSPALSKKLSIIQNSLEAGRSILFLGQSIDINTQRAFFSFLRQHLPVENHKIIPIILIGKVVLNLEVWWRGTYQGMDASLASRYIDYASNVFPLVLHTLEEWGRQHTTLIPVLHDIISADVVAEAAQHVLAALGMKERPEIDPPLPFAYFVNTLTAQRLLDARQVCHNDWPRLDNAVYMTALQQVEQDWMPELQSPLACRQALREKSRKDQTRLEELLALSPHALDAPDWYYTVPEEAKETPLRPERLKTFVAALPLAEREVLLRRFVNDRDLLTDDQKALAKVLAEAEETTFERLEEQPPQPVLTVLTMTRNHEKYIGQCIESVLAQKTDFPVRHLILDHYSEDETPQIVSRYAREYPSIRPVLLNNFFILYQNVHSLFVRCKSEYAALCDGDDYYLDPLKLQKQMDFLKSHPRCALCFHPVQVVYEDGRQPDIFPPHDMLPRGIREEYYLADLFKCNMIQTNSVVYKWRFRDGLPEWFRADICPGDWYWHLLHAEQGRIGFLPDVMSAYRRHGTALYKDSRSDRLKHRRKFGMPELETYHVVNEHFQNRYFLPLANLANGILSDFLRIRLDEGDGSLLDKACRTYPKFGEYFLNTIRQKVMSQKDQS